MGARIVSFVNFKGGVGKTALAVNVATAMAHTFGERVLLIDLDPQSCSSICLLGPERWEALANNQPHLTVYGLLKSHNPIGPCTVRETVAENGVFVVPKLHLLPSCYDLMDFETSGPIAAVEPPYILFWKQIMGITDSYDFILIDCPPNLYRTTQCAIFASHHILVPCNPDALSVIGLSLLARKIWEFRQQTEPAHHTQRPGQLQASISGIIINNRPTVQSKANIRAEAEIRVKLSFLKGKGWTEPDAVIFKETVRSAADFRTGSFEYTPLLFAVAVKNQALLDDYRHLANHIRTRFKED